MRQSLMIAIAAITLASATTAAAQQAWRIGPDAFNVHLRDLDLRQPAGRAQALARIEAVASRLCEAAGTRAARRACREQVVAKAAGLPGTAFVRLAQAEREQAGVRLARSR